MAKKKEKSNQESNQEQKQQQQDEAQQEEARQGQLIPQRAYDADRPVEQKVADPPGTGDTNADENPETVGDGPSGGADK